MYVITYLLTSTAHPNTKGLHFVHSNDNNYVYLHVHRMLGIVWMDGHCYLDAHMVDTFSQSWVPKTGRWNDHRMYKFGF